jgi:hypothetical protein
MPNVKRLATGGLALLHDRGDRARRGHAAGPRRRLVGLAHLGEERQRDGDGIAVQAQGHGYDYGLGRTPQAEGGGKWHRRQHVRAIESADIEPVADVGPGHLPMQHERKPGVTVHSAFLGDDEGGAVDEGNETDADLRVAAAATMRDVLPAVSTPSRDSLR